METLAALWNAAPFWAPLVALACGALAILRLVWRRGSKSRARIVEESAAESGMEFLDSSHIGFASLGDVKKRPHRRA